MSMQSERSTPLWRSNQDNDEFSRPGPVEGLTADIVIIGAGITGLSVAYQLAVNGKQVIVVDDGDIGGGNTGRTTAHLSNVLDDRFVNLRRERGRDVAHIATESHRRRSIGSSGFSARKTSIAISAAWTAISCLQRATRKSCSTKSSRPRGKPAWPWRRSAERRRACRPSLPFVFPTRRASTQ